MSTTSRRGASTRRAVDEGAPSGPPTEGAQLARWGGIAGLAGGACMVGAAIVTVALGLPDASDVETLTDYADIRSGRIAEHFLYLGALVFFALHAVVLHRLLRSSHPAAALFGTVVAGIGLVIMAAGSLLHVSTSPLADRYNESGTSPEDLRAIEYAWAGAQSVFDTMLATGVLLVPIGIVLFGVAMRTASIFGQRVATAAVGLGAVGTVGGAVAIVDPGSMSLAVGVLAITVFHLMTGWKTRDLVDQPDIDLTEPVAPGGSRTAKPIG